MMKRLLMGLGIMAIAPAFLITSVAQAQSVNSSQSDALPRFTSPDAPAVTQTLPTNTTTVTRDQAPLPLQTVYSTPIDEFEPPFADVSTNHWAYEAVTRLYYSGIVSGFPAD